MTYGPDFVALQTEDVAGLAQFYEHSLGMVRAEQSPPQAVLFDSKPIPFAIREPLSDLSSVAVPGAGVALWLLCDDATELHDRLTAMGVPIIKELGPSPFGMTFSFRDPAGYTVTMHDKG